MQTEEGVYCRLCADLKLCSDLTNLELDLNAAKRREVVNKLLRLNIPVDFSNDLPKTVCFECINSLERAIDFITTVVQAQEAFNTEYSIFLEINNTEFNLEDENQNTLDYGDDSGHNDDEESDKINEKPANEVEYANSKLRNKDSIPKTACKRPLLNKRLSIDDEYTESWQDIMWYCSFCHRQFPTGDKLIIHMMQYHRTCNIFTCTECKTQQFNIEDFVSHICKHQPFLILTCRRCFMKCASLKEMKKHKEAHLCSDYICSGCDTSFLNVTDLDKHISEFYRDENMSLSPVTNHESLTCVICQKTLKSKLVLSRHLLLHTERKRNYTCDNCNKSFYNKQSLIQHMIMHTNNRPYKCEICQFAYKLRSQLRKHVSLHFKPKLFGCDKCSKQFKQKKELVSHHIVHTDKRPYICGYCKKGFRYKHLLKQHINLHTGVKPYSCDVCPSQAFTNWSNYNKHMKHKHGIDKSRRKKTSDGLLPIDQAIGKITSPDKEEMIKWKKNMLGTLGRLKKLKKS